MTQIKAPKSLRSLTAPWSLTRSAERHEQLRALEPTRDTVSSALDSLEILLASSVAFPNVPDESLPDYMTYAWGLFADALAKDIPTLQEIDSTRVEAALVARRGSVPAAVVEACTARWGRYVVEQSASASLRWLTEPGRLDGDQATRLLDIASTHWRSVTLELAGLLVSSTALLCWQGARPLLEEVQQVCEPGSDLAASARDYVRWMDRQPDGPASMQRDMPDRSKGT